jgi:hypothetical protein
VRVFYIKEELRYFTFIFKFLLDYQILVIIHGHNFSHIVSHRDNSMRNHILLLDNPPLYPTLFRLIVPYNFNVVKEVGTL